MPLQVTDGVIRRMIDKWLKAGALEDGLASAPAAYASRMVLLPSWFGTEVPYNEELILASVHTKPIRAQPEGDQTSRKEASDSIFADARSSVERLAAPKHNRESYAFDALHANSLICKRIPWASWPGRNSCGFAVTRHPTAEWLAQQIIEAFPWATAPTYLVRDNDGAYGQVFRRRVRAMGIRDRPISPDRRGRTHMPNG